MQVITVGEPEYSLLPADRARELTKQKIAEFTHTLQTRVVQKINLAIEAGKFKIEHDMGSSTMDVLANLKSNLETAGYKITPQQNTHAPVWSISWDKPANRGTSMIMG